MEVEPGTYSSQQASLLLIQPMNHLRLSINEYTTRMWANAQPDGRPAEHRWRPLFNVAKFG